MFRIDRVYDYWSRERALRHVAYWGFWLLFYPTINISYNLGKWDQYFLFELIVMPVKLVNTYFIVYFLMPVFLYKKKYITFFVWVSVCCTLAGLISRLLDSYVVNPLVFDKEPFEIWSSSKIVYKFLDQLNIAAFVVLIKIVQRQLQQEKSNNRLKEEKLDAELKLLKNQLQPHFLFNTLNNLYGMVLTKDDKAPDVLVKMSDMLSYMLYECDDSYVPLDKELKILDNYTELELIRYGEKLSFEFIKEGDTKGQQIAPLLLFPLLENAFKHGPAKLENETFIRAKLTILADSLIFEVINSKSNEVIEKEKLKSGIGLENVKTRLELLYSGKYEFSIKNHETSFEVLLKLNTD